MKTLCILGGSSAGTLILIEQIAKAQVKGNLPSLRVKLWGRSIKRLDAIKSYSDYKLLLADEFPSECQIHISTHTSLATSLERADIILCQIRPGGLTERAIDEQLPLEYDIPGDEGLGPSGLACFLRSRQTMTSLIESCREFAPTATLLMMTSPLGFMVDLATQVFGSECFGVCELPTVSINRILNAVQGQVGTIGKVFHYGLNHQAWLHHFIDTMGNDVTDQVLDALPDHEIVDVAVDIIRREGAVPLPYLRLYYHTEREVQKQISRIQPRGLELDLWARSIKSALHEMPSAGYYRVNALLNKRNMDWYEFGVVPTLSAFLGATTSIIPLNKRTNRNDGFLGSVVELPCAVREGRVDEVDVPPLPRGAHELMSRLVHYESHALMLEATPHIDDIASVLYLHPLVPTEQIAEKLASKLWGRVYLHSGI